MKRNYAMKKDYTLLVLVILAALLVWAFAPVAGASGFGGSSGVGGVPSAKPCTNAGYTLIVDHLCRRDTMPAGTSLTKNVVTLVTGPAGAKGLILKLTSLAYPANAAGSRYANIRVFSDAGATNIVTEFLNGSYEEVARVAGLAVSSKSIEVHVRTNASGQVWLMAQGDAAGVQIFMYDIVGYYF